MGQWMQEILHETADAGDTLWDSGCSSFSIRQRMHETLYQTGDAGISLSLRQQMMYSLYWTADA